MKKNCKTKVFCRLSMIRGALCGLLLLSLTILLDYSPVYGQQNVKRISLKLEASGLLEAFREINRFPVSPCKQGDILSGAQPRN